MPWISKVLCKRIKIKWTDKWHSPCLTKLRMKIPSTRELSHDSQSIEGANLHAPTTAYATLALLTLGCHCPSSLSPPRALATARGRGAQRTCQSSSPFYGPTEVRAQHSVQTQYLSKWMTLCRTFLIPKLKPLCLLSGSVENTNLRITVMHLLFL